jgi:hypothetical protein
MLTPMRRMIDEHHFNIRRRSLTFVRDFAALSFAPLSDLQTFSLILNKITCIGGHPVLVLPVPFYIASYRVCQWVGDGLT